MPMMMVVMAMRRVMAVIIMIVPMIGMVVFKRDVHGSAYTPFEPTAKLVLDNALNVIM
ncbi:hypothetical protein GGR11_001935 [Brevundimonas mediterranea]|uniref:Uncharacterized protein n=1 Tax=Brevundimonas mediterranea TaxID=74329 RepID=A0A7W6F0E4_9CAUL|nr:hypothetical protein [Brevundimonas mediterranea]